MEEWNDGMMEEWNDGKRGYTLRVASYGLKHVGVERVGCRV